MTTGVKVELLKVGYTRFSGRAIGLPTWRFVDIPALAALIRHRNCGAILFDAGYGSNLNAVRGLSGAIYRTLLPGNLPTNQQIDHQLRARDVDPAALAFIFLSHVHPDHAGGLCDLPARPLLVSRTARGVLFDRRRHGFGRRLRNAHFAELIPPHVGEYTELIEDRTRIDLSANLPGFEVGHDLLNDGTLIAVPLPGHAPGQFGLFCQEHCGRLTFLIADAAWTIANISGSAEPSAIAALAIHEPRAYRETLERLRNLHRARPDIRIVPSHCAQTYRTQMDD